MFFSAACAFPAIFGPNADQPLDAEIVRAKFSELCAEIEAKTGRTLSPNDAAEGFLRIANESMAEAPQKIPRSSAATIQPNMR